MLIIGVLFTYLYFSISVYLLFIGFLRINGEKNKNIILFLSFGSGPIIMAWVLEKIMYFSPGYSDIYYISSIIGIFSLGFVFNKNEIPCFISHIKRVLINQKVTIISFFLLLGVSLYLSLLLPPYGNDPLEYLTVSRKIYSYKSFVVYPLIDASFGDGYYPWTHPSGYVGLIVWGYLIQSTAEYAGTAKLISPLFFFFTLVLFYYLVYLKLGRIAAFISMVLFFATPLYVYTTLIFHIDPIRLFAFFSPIVFCSIKFKNVNYRHFIVLGIFIGTSIHAHSIGIISLFYSIFFILVFYKLRNILKIKYILIALAVCGMVVSIRYYDNYKKFGYILGDNTQVWNIKKINNKEYLKISRDLKLPENRLLKGVFKGFFLIIPLGFIHWLFLLSFLMVLHYLVRIKKIKIIDLYNEILQYDQLYLMSFFAIVLWYIVTIFSTIIGTDVFIKNDRYLLTIFPFIIYITSLQIGYLLKKKSV